jgi:hypothetical protein
MSPRHKRLKSIHTPPRQDRITPSQRRARADDGPNAFQLQRQAEQINASTYCEVDGGAIGITKNGNFSKQIAADAAFAASCAIAKLRYEDRITLQQYRAGLEYARLFYLSAGKTHPKQSALAKAMATSLEDRIKQANAAARELRDDGEYEDWLSDQHTLYKRAVHRLNHLPGLDHVERRILRTYINRTVVESIYPVNGRWLNALRLGLKELAELFGIEEEK